ncbi:hypothetical protein BSL78_20116 [Apostichopus japonicus]|uniref:Uncharacterized protein n=1 Tax=Stichopus japonicus TaxID=307972 RepID=A0A2G8K4U9_STIJA|nr:hypothetical protein BSL78_20116 [Apostichopus japonicus]
MAQSAYNLTLGSTLHATPGSLPPTLQPTDRYPKPLKSHISSDDSCIFHTLPAADSIFDSETRFIRPPGTHGHDFKGIIQGLARPYFDQGAVQGGISIYASERLGVCQQALRRLSPSAVQAQDLTLDPIGSDQLADFVQSNSNFF